MTQNNDHKNKVITLGMGKCLHELKRVTILSEPDMPSHIECKLCGAINVKRTDYFSPDNWMGMGLIIKFIREQVDKDIENTLFTQTFSKGFAFNKLSPELIAEAFYYFISHNPDLEPFASNQRLQEELKEVER